MLGDVQSTCDIPIRGKFDRFGFYRLRYLDLADHSSRMERRGLSGSSRVSDNGGQPKSRNGRDRIDLH